MQVRACCPPHLALVPLCAVLHLDAGFAGGSVVVDRDEGWDGEFDGA